MYLHCVARFGAIWHGPLPSKNVYSIIRMKGNRMPVEPDAVPAAEGRLDSWKEIAAYLRKGLRTVQRWERTEGLPVRRLGQGSVFAYKSELDAWWRTHSRTLAEEPETAISPASELPRVRRAFSKQVIAIALGAATAAALSVWSLRPRALEMYRAVPLTADHGWESAAAFSPDGRRIAYLWAPPEARAHVYLKTIGSDSKTRLTSGPDREASPVWSADSRSIAFIRFATDHWKVMRIGETGGAETQIAEVTLGTKLVWTADGQWLIAVDGPAKQRSIIAIAVADGTKHALTKPFEFGYAGFGISPDARRLIFSYAGPGSVAVYELPLGFGLTPVGEPRAILTERLWISEMEVARDARHIVYVDGSWDEGSLKRLWLSPRSKAETVYATLDRLLNPALSPDSRRIAFAATKPDHVEIWQKSLSDPAAAPSALLSSTHSEMNPQYSPDGRLIAFHSTRTGASEIWIADRDGANARRLTYTNARNTATPRWSPDGKWIAFESNQSGPGDVYIIPIAGGPARRLTDDPAIDAIPRWSRDGRFIYFVSYRTGRYEVWKVDAAGGKPVQVTHDGGFVAVESADGRYLYYSQTRNYGPVFRMPLTGGPSEEVIPDIRGLFFTVTERGIYFESRGAIWFWDAASRRTTKIFQPAKPMGVGMDVSPDGQTLLFTQVDRDTSGADLYLIDGFR
jgi:Tol biopolymer transport system component